MRVFLGFLCALELVDIMCLDPDLSLASDPMCLGDKPVSTGVPVDNTS